MTSTTMTSKEILSEVISSLEWAGDDYVELTLSTEVYDALVALLSRANETREKADV